MSERSVLILTRRNRLPRWRLNDPSLVSCFPALRRLWLVAALGVAAVGAEADVKIANRSQMAADRTPEATLEVQSDSSGSDSNALLVRGPDDEARLLVRDDGRVGIGSEAPDFTLDVNGGMRITTTPTISTANKALVRDPTSGQLSEQAFEKWVEVGPVEFRALTATRSPGTDPTLDPNAFVNRHRYRELGNNWVEEWIQVMADGTGGTVGSGYYLVDTLFPLDTSEHVFYGGNLDAPTTTTAPTYGIKLGEGVVSHVNYYARIYAVPVSATEVGFVSIAGNAGNRFINAGHYAISASNWQLNIKFIYKKQ